MPSITVLIATSSASELQQLRANLATDHGIRVVGHCPGLMETFNFVEHSPPDLVVIARQLTLCPEFELMQVLFETLDVRWLVVDRSGPPPNSSASQLRDDRVVNRAVTSDLFPLQANAPAAELTMQIHAVTRAARRAVQVERPTARSAVRSPGKLVLIGASTGGIEALVRVLSNFPEDCPPTIIVQHTSKGFGAGLVNLMSMRCRARVVSCHDGLELTPGMVCIAASTQGHAVLTGHNPLKIGIDTGDRVCGHMPSIDRLFLSAVPQGRRVVAALLTGMGSDGAAGLLELRKAGAVTMAQDAATSVVYGMPRVAWENGGAARQLPLDQIGPALLQSSKAIA